MISLITNAHNSVAALVYSWDRNVPSDRLSGRTEVRQDLVLSRREKGWRSREIFQRGLLTEQQSRCEWEKTVFYCQQTYLNVNEINPKHCILFYSFYKFYCYAWYDVKMEKRPLTIVTTRWFYFLQMVRYNVGLPQETLLSYWTIIGGS